MTDDLLHLACVADASYAPWCATMLHSALQRTGGGGIVVHHLHPADMNATVVERLGAMVRALGATFRPTGIEPGAVEGLPGTDQFPSIIWYRSLLPELRPELDRVLYLDSDTLVTDSLRPLWETDLGDDYAAAVLNLVEPRLVTQPQRVGIPVGQPYFNSGVLLMDLAAMRRDSCVAALHEHARRYEGTSIWPDQDAFNFVFGRRCTLVHPRWNSQNSFFYWPQAADVLGAEAHAEATASPAILHFEGPPATKPWHYLNDHPWRVRYWEHLRATPFAPSGPQGRTMANVARRHLPAGARERVRRWRTRLR